MWWGARKNGVGQRDQATRHVCVPEGKYLDSDRLSTHTVVEIIMNAVKMNTADTGKFGVSSLVLR